MIEEDDRQDDVPACDSFYESFYDAPWTYRTPPEEPEVSWRVVGHGAAAWAAVVVGVVLITLALLLGARAAGAGMDHGPPPEAQLTQL